MLRKIRHNLRKLIYFKNYSRLQKLKASNAALASALEAQDKYQIDLLHRPYAHKFAPKSSTFERLAYDFDYFRPLLGKSFCAQGFSLRFVAEPKVISEGIISLKLSLDGKELYTISLSFIKEFLLITCAQGLAKTAELKEASKAASGLRPLNLLLHFAQMLAIHTGKKLAAVRSCAQLSQHKKRKAQFIDYDQIWRQNAEITAEYEHIFCIQISQKSPEQIASKKRSEYRRRYELLDALIKEFHESR